MDGLARRPALRRSSPTSTQAHELQGKLMLIVGELDRNVDPASTMQVVNALIKADKDFDLLVVPGAGTAAAADRTGGGDSGTSSSATCSAPTRRPCTDTDQAPTALGTGQGLRSAP